MDITRIQKFDGWYAKRDDEAFATDTDSPAGSKVRQYAKMAQANAGMPMIVGCSAHSAMQIYVAAAAKAAGVKGIVYTAARAVKTDATAYAERLGVELHEERPAYLNVVQSRASEHAKLLPKGYVKWDPVGAVKDAADQVVNIGGLGIKRIIVPTGSGLTASGVLAGLWLGGCMNIPVLCVAVSGMADAAKIKQDALRCIGAKAKLPRLSIVRAKSKYDQWEAAVLPDGIPLDPYYAAKALRYVKKGDLLWIPGVRPLSAMPVKCQEAIAKLRS